MKQVQRRRLRHLVEESARLAVHEFGRNTKRQIETERLSRTFERMTAEEFRQARER